MFIHSSGADLSVSSWLLFWENISQHVQEFFTHASKAYFSNLGRCFLDNTKVIDKIGILKNWGTNTSCLIVFKMRNSQHFYSISFNLKKYLMLCPNKNWLDLILIWLGIDYLSVLNQNLKVHKVWLMYPSNMVY